MREIDAAMRIMIEMVIMVKMVIMVNMVIIVIMVIMVIMIIRVIRAIRFVRITSVKSSIGIITHQGHISQVNANDQSVTHSVSKSHSSLL